MNFNFLCESYVFFVIRTIKVVLATDRKYCDVIMKAQLLKHLLLMVMS